MKKTVRIVAIATALTIAIMLSCAYAMPAGAEELYPKLAVVVSTEEAGGIYCINCLDKDGNVWSFYDDDPSLEEGDILALLMERVDEIPEDDHIVGYEWEGYTEEIDEFIHVTGWRR